MTKKRIRLDNMKALRRFNNYLINEVFNDNETDLQKIKLLSELVKNQKQIIESEKLETKESELNEIFNCNLLQSLIS